MNEETTPHIIHTHDSSYSKSEREPIQHQLDQSEVEELDERIEEQSPDGRPAYPTIRAKEMLLLCGGSLLAVLAVSGIAYALWGSNTAFMVLGLGIVFAILGNPVVWAMYLRSKERESIYHEKADSSLNEQTQSDSRSQ